MAYLSVAEVAGKWGVSVRTVRNYCAAGKIPGAFLTGKTWNVPDNAQRPKRANQKADAPQTLLDIREMNLLQNWELALKPEDEENGGDE